MPRTLPGRENHRPSVVADLSVRCRGAASTFIILTLLAILTLDASASAAAAVDPDRAAALRADRLAAMAQRSGNVRSVGRTLDTRFTLTDPTGSVLDKARFLAGVRNMAPGEDIAEPEARIYGGLAVVTGSHHVPSLNTDTRYLHVFIRKGASWVALAFFETAIQSLTTTLPQTSRVLPTAMPAEGGAASCDNPCTTIPLSPRTSAERAVVEAYKQVELESVTGDVDAFATHLADELLIILPDFAGKSVTRAVAVASHQRMRDQKIYYPPVPVTEASVAVFGDGALMVSRHDLPPDPAKSSILAQVWVLRDARWQLALSQQVRITPVVASPAGIEAK